MAFEWDEAKSRRNAEERGLPFDCVLRFDFESAVIQIDDRRDYGETRKVALGVLDERVHSLTYTERGETVRVISLRKANRREVRRYVRDR